MSSQQYKNNSNNLSMITAITKMLRILPTVSKPLYGVITCALVFFACVTSAQTSGSSSTTSVFDGDPVQLVNEISDRIQQKKSQIADIRGIIKAEGQAPSVETQEEIAELESDIERLQSSLILSITGHSTLSRLYAEPETETTWQEDVVDILKPLADTVKSITKRPRQIADHRATLDLIDQKEKGLRDALEKFSYFEETPLETNAAELISGLNQQWQDELLQLEEEKLIASQKLEELIGENDQPLNGLMSGVKRFFLGTGLTMTLAVVAGAITYLGMRFCWWFYSTKIASKDTRRNSTLFRLFSYSYHLITVICVVIVILLVIYTREDLLLLAIAFVLLAGLVLNLKQFLPKYLNEARLLLNLGGVRVDERVVYNGLPWQVKSINVYSVLHNPSLDGIARLPLSEMENLISRPVRNNLWFPTKRGDFVILPDGLLGQVKYQTPDLVEITVRGGMAQTFTTADFYVLNVINLSRDATFGISVTFGLDYSLQSIAVNDIPETLKAAISEELIKRGYEKKVNSLVVELSAAGASSLDFLIFATMDNSVAGDFYKLERIILQTCVEVSNRNSWTIPFPQLTVHNV